MDFKQILLEVQKTKKPIKTYPYKATQYLGVTRRGLRVIDTVNRMLEEHDLFAEPAFAGAWFYGEMEIKPKPKVAAGNSDFEETDPTPRLSLLKAANLNQAKDSGVGNGLISVTRGTSLTEAITLLILNDFSQLPILSGQREVDGVISWKSIGRAISLGKKCITVSDCKDEATILNHDEPLFNAVKFILEKEFVLVRQKDKTISGIVTVTDIGEQFIAMAEPFLIIEQIENHVRKLLDKKFDPEDLIIASSSEVKMKPIKNLSDLTFGHYVKILEDPKKFAKLNLNIDRALVTKQLEDVRKIRNDVMHFDPDGITVENLALLRQTVLFLHTLTTAIK
jgi:predicted transcriptional regulator